MVLKADLDFKTAPWPSVSSEAKDCVRRLLNRNAPQRATAEQVLQHPWLSRQGLASDRPLDNVVIQRMRQVRQRCSLTTFVPCAMLPCSHITQGTAGPHLCLSQQADLGLYLTSS